MRRRPWSWMWCLAIVAALPLAGCKSKLLRPGAQRAIARRLHDLIGPARKYRVRILGTYDNDLVRGHARTIRVTGEQVLVHQEILLDSIWLEIRGLRYGGEKPYFVSVKDSEMEVELSDAALNDYLRERGTRYNPLVVFHRNSVTLTMTYQLLGQDVPVIAKGHLEVEDRSRIMFRADEVNLRLLDMPGFNEQFIEDRVNPLLDVSKLELPLKLDSVRLDPGRAFIHGSATIGGEDPK